MAHIGEYDFLASSDCSRGRRRSKDHRPLATRGRPDGRKDKPRPSGSFARRETIISVSAILILKC